MEVFRHYPEVQKCLDGTSHQDALRLKEALERTHPQIREAVLITHITPTPTSGMWTVYGQLTFAINDEPDYTALLRFVEQEIAHHESAWVPVAQGTTLSPLVTLRRNLFRFPHRSSHPTSTHVCD